MQWLNQYILLFLKPLLPVVFYFNNVCAVTDTEQSILTAPLQLQFNLFYNIHIFIYEVDV